jgi:hypothetical protein
LDYPEAFSEIISVDTRMHALFQYAEAISKSAPAEQMKVMVGEMVVLIEGSSNGNAYRVHRVKPGHHRSAPAGQKALIAHGKPFKTAEVRPNHIIVRRPVPPTQNPYQNDIVPFSNWLKYP